MGSEAIEPGLPPAITAIDGLNLDAISAFDRIDRLRILLGASWCDCGCGLLVRTPYRTLADLSGIPQGTLHKLAGRAKVYIDHVRLGNLHRVSGLPPERILSILNVHLTPQKEDIA